MAKEVIRSQKPLAFDAPAVPSAREEAAPPPIGLWPVVLPSELMVLLEKKAQEKRTTVAELLAKAIAQILEV